MHRSSSTKAAWAARVVGSLLCLAIALSPAVSSAQADLIERGIELRQEGHDEEAAEIFARAWEGTRDARALAQLALAEQALGRWVEAHAHLREALATSAEWVERHRATLQGALATIEEHLGRLEVDVSEDSATVRVDGRPVGEMPAYVAVGTVVVEVEAPGHVAVQRTVQTEAGRLTRVSLALVPSLSPVAEPAVTEPIEVADSTSDEDAGGSVLLPIGAGLAAAAGLSLVGMAVGLGVREDAARRFYTCPAPMSTRCPGLVGIHDSSRDAAIGLGVVAGAATIAAIVVLVLGVSEADEEERARLRPGPGDVGLALEVGL